MSNETFCPVTAEVARYLDTQDGEAWIEQRAEEIARETTTVWLNTGKVVEVSDLLICHDEFDSQLARLLSANTDSDKLSQLAEFRNFSWKILFPIAKAQAYEFAEKQYHQPRSGEDEPTAEF